MVGHQVQKLETIEPLYKCPSCSLLLRDPIQLVDCAHRLCQSCANEQKEDLIICPECHQTTPRERLKLDRGFINDMQILSIICSFCNWTGLLKFYQNHLNQTHPNPICEYCGEQFSLVNDLNRHILYKCDKVTVDCPLKPFGCKDKILRANLNSHYLTEQHQIILMNFILQLKSKSFISMGNHSTIDLPPTTVNVINLVEEFDDPITTLLAGVDVISADGQRIKNECVHYENTLQLITRDSLKVKKSIEEQYALIDGMKSNQNSCDQDILFIKQNIDNIKVSSHDGTFIWKITNIKDKMDAAKSLRQSSIYSPPFYSSPTGYKMCLRMYLDGDGNARGTHISLFFVLMRSEYDAILHFPFCFKVIFCLYDQTGQQQHIIDAFRPDVTSNSFQRPRSDMNIASGITKFAPLKIFQQDNNPYIRDDTMFVKVIIDFGNLPKTILSYALSISPGLTSEIQQTMIREEVEKQQQISNSLKKHNGINESWTLGSQESDNPSNIKQ